MEWVLFSASLPAQGSSSPRVTLWRRLQRLGAIAPVSGVYLLPARESCVEAFTWLAQELRQSGAEALVMRVTQVEGISDEAIRERFQAARREEYTALADELRGLEAASRQPTADRVALHEQLERLQRRHGAIGRIDYFGCAEGRELAADLARIAAALTETQAVPVAVPLATLAMYQDTRWVTRPRPHVDRLACAWLIRRFINPTALIRYSHVVEPGEVAFDMADAPFTHQGPLCTFETMVHTFGLDDPGLRRLAELVHEIDLRDGKFQHPEIEGVDAILQGWLHLDLADMERETRGLALFDGLYAAFQQSPPYHAVEGEP